MLSDVYRHLGDYENVRGVHSKGISTHAQTEVALNFESVGEFSEAQKVYQELLGNQDLVDHHLEQEVQLWKKGFYESYQKEDQWDKLASRINSDLNGDLSGVWESKSSEAMLGPLMESHTHQILDKPDLPNSMFEFLNKSFSDKNKMSALKKQNIFQFASFLACKGKNAKALNYITNATQRWKIETFERNLFCPRNLGKLHMLQAKMELKNYLTYQTAPSKGNYSTEHQQLWARSTPQENDDLKSWDCYFTAKIVPCVTCRKSLYMDVPSLGQPAS